jgi:hypothetical protein
VGAVPHRRIIREGFVLLVYSWCERELECIWGLGFLQESPSATVVISLFFSEAFSLSPPVDADILPNHINSCVLYLCN